MSFESTNRQEVNIGRISVGGISSGSLYFCPPQVQKEEEKPRDSISSEWRTVSSWLLTSKLLTGKLDWGDVQASWCRPAGLFVTEGFRCQVAGWSHSRHSNTGYLKHSVDPFALSYSLNKDKKSIAIHVPPLHLSVQAIAQCRGGGGRKKKSG